MPRERVLADLIDELIRQQVEEIVSWHDNGRSRRIGQPQGELLFNNTSPESEKLRVHFTGSAVHAYASTCTRACHLQEEQVEWLVIPLQRHLPQLLSFSRDCTLYLCV